METPKQLKDTSFSTNNSDNNETLEELERFIGRSLETSFIDGLSTSSISLSSSQNNIIEQLKQRLEKLEEIHELKFKHENEIKNLKQNFQKLTEENNELKAENDQKINFLEEKIKKGLQKIKSENENKIKSLKQEIQQLKSGNDRRPGQVEELTGERNEIRELENNYDDLFKRYETIREHCVRLKNSEKELKNSLAEEATKYEELKDIADSQLHQANLEIQKIKKEHEENTLGLKYRLKMKETYIQTLNLTIQGKDNQIDELNKLVEELMEKKGISGDGDDPEDGGSMLSTISYEW
uniref:Transforming acidic coiled-coil-containing protein C-terminal domain-containing protein n=1 Tax=Meloidogyne enterolobii TaxID=390850 RepID=A0A6V7VCL3_MELEN|nr:unnamed protein product [Meloidogyne enterolobii]